MAESELDVVVQMGGEEVLAGRLWAQRGRGAEPGSFRYAADYLARQDAYQLDPVLVLSDGRQQTPAGCPVFGAFRDCAPDGWGRGLLDAHEQQRARREGGDERSFGELDYLLCVRDDLRQGALRFRDPEGGVFVADDPNTVPRLSDLPRLVDAADRFQRDEAGEAELTALLHGGTSLGGARPKSRVVDDAGRVAIAKLPSTAGDEWDVMRWEAVALQLARQSGIQVADWMVHPIDGQAVLVVDRFDRAGDLRVGYVSARTMLGTVDGERRSYLDIVDVVERTSPHAGDDLRQLWRRIAFSILITNTDDHLRNHGFLRTGGDGWALSPAFDLNPDPRPGPKLLSTAIDRDDREPRVDTLMGVAEHFRLGPDDARAILEDVSRATGRWRAVAAQAGLGRSATEQMEPAFEHPQARLARELTGVT